jgi:DNA-binding MarR family transcriptional regulator
MVARSNAARKKETTSAAQPLTGIKGGREGQALALDRVIHERMRLAIVSALAVNASLSFTELRGLLDTSDGNLSVHARKLEEAGYVACTKTFEDRVPRTEYRLTAAGRRALEQYLGHMEALIAATRAG